MKKISAFFFALLPLLQTGCSSLDEAIYEPDAPNYQSFTDSQGNKRQERKRIVGPGTPRLNSFTPVTRSLIGQDTRNFSGSSAHTASALASPLELTSLYLKSENNNLMTVNTLLNSQAANMDLIYERVNKYYDWSLGLSLLASDHTYLGFTGGAHIYLPWKLSPFVGIGAYGGDSKSCRYEDLGGGYAEETCEKYLLMALTLDYGLQLRLNHFLQIKLFARNFSQTEQGDPRTQTLYGMGLSTYF